MKNFLLLLTVVVFTLHVPFAGAQKFIPIKVEEYKLDNGLTVILQEDHTKPQVFGAVTVRAGGKNDPDDATGMAHYQEHMLFKGTDELGTIDWEKEKGLIEKIFSLYDQLGQTSDEEKRKEIQMEINRLSLDASNYAIPNEMSNLIKSIGGTDLNAGTGSDMTIYYNAFPPNQMEKWLELYSHRFINPVFRSFQAELEVVYEEKNLYNDIFFFPLLEQFNKYFFKQHPYGQQTLIGSIDDLKNPSLTKMYEFYKTFYIPNNMALILVGDFDPASVKPLIEKSFGKWEEKPLPEVKTWEEKPFAGREYVEVKLTPIKLGLLGFRTPPAGHDDEIILEICNGILSNENQSGLLDKLSIDNKLLAAQLITMPYNDYGCTILLLVPKILGQKLEEAETLALDEIRKVKNGEFDEWRVEAIKQELYRNYQLSLESNEYKAEILASAFGQNRKMEDVLDYPEKLKKITKDDVVRVANTYYGDNYLAFFSKMGFPKKEKIDKPGYEPLIANTDAKSEFTKRFEKIPSGSPVENYVDFNKDVTQLEIGENARMLYVNNPKNDIFSLTLRYGIGNKNMPLLEYASDMMNYSGTEKMDVNQLKQEFSKIGCTYSVSSDDSYLYISVEGVESSVRDAIRLTGTLIDYPALEQDKIENLVDGEKTNRKMERSEPDNVADALFDYIRFREKSDYIDRLSMKEIKALNADSLENTFKKAAGYDLTVDYCGTVSPDDLKNEISKYILGKKVLVKGNSPVITDPELHSENTIFVVDKKKALQSKVYLFMNGKVNPVDDDPVIDAFNLYFGGDFSGLVLQEIREYRSMAYSAGAWFSTPDLKGHPSSFIGYVGTQADKTNQAIDIFVGLIREMPVKKERMEMIRQYLVQSALTSRPEFRDLGESVEQWKLRGYTDDPARVKVPSYKKLQFQNIVSFYEENIMKTPLVICIVGNVKRIDLKALEKYGKIVKVKEKDLFTD
ncbi:MAG: insulinase family protein [Bacteroidota bacterium]